MDIVYLFWLFAIGALVGGGVIGAIVYRNLAPGKKEADDLRAELDAAKLEMEAYKTSVNSHFDKTAELVNELTQDYVKVYQHLAEGAQVLGEGRDFANVLERHQGKVLISVDSDKASRPAIVSDGSVAMQKEHASAREASVNPESEVAAENVAAGNANVDAGEEHADSEGTVAGSEEKMEPVINVDKLELNPDADNTAAKPVKANDSGASGESLAAQSAPQKESTPSPSA